MSSLSFQSSQEYLYSLGLDLAFLNNFRFFCCFLVLAVALNVKAEQVCIGTCHCTGQMSCKLSFVFSVDALQHAAFLFFC